VGPLWPIELMMPKIKTANAMLVLIMLVGGGCGVTSGSREMVALELESHANTLDGCTACVCRVKGELQPDTEENWWLSFGLVRLDDAQRWEAVASSNHCGSGSFERIQSDFQQTVGTPYVVLDLSTTAVTLIGDERRLDLHLSRRKLSGVDPDGEPLYTQSVQKRSFGFTDEADILLPLLIADESEQERLGVHEVLLRIHTTLLGQSVAAAYGSVTVVADVPGAEVMLDGGFVGRTTEEPPLLLENVHIGMREIRVRDFSGREASRQVKVEIGETAGVMLDVLRLTQTGGNGLAPIGRNPQGHPEYWRAKDSASVVLVPAGEFLMGSPEGVGETHEQPQHRVDLADFLIDKTEVSWRQFHRYAQVTGSPLPETPLWGRPDDYPASFIAWREAQEYCKWAGGRLPTEAEWEKAARGTDGRRYPWGDEWDARRCNSISGGQHRPQTAGSLPDCVSVYGVLDISGNMWEWVADRYQADYYEESPSRQPVGPETGDFRVVRGGGWMTQPVWLHPAYRFRLPPTARRPDLGFRCSMDLQE